MKYPQILGKVLKSFWCITEEKHYAILSALDNHLSGNVALMPMGEDDGEDDEWCYYEDESTAVIPVHGILGKHLSSMEMSCGGCSMDRIASMLQVAGSSPRIQRVVMRFDTPGGTVTGTPELGKKIREVAAIKPVIGFTDSECCSGGLWLASQCSAFYSTESASIGSVGVRMILMDYTEAMKNEGVKVNAISSGRYKLAGASFKPLEDDEREMFQAESDRLYAEFKAAILSNRKANEECLQGQIYRGQAATEAGFVDGLVDDFDEVMEKLG